MPTDPQDQAGNQALAEQLYNTIMADIEPDLLLESIPLLDQLYAGETKDKKDARMKRYEVAYKKFDAEFGKFMGEVTEEVKTARRQALQAKEAEARTQESTVIGSLEAAFR